MDFYGSSDERWGSQLQRKKLNMSITTDKRKKERACVHVRIYSNFVIYNLNLPNGTINTQIMVMKDFKI